MIGKAVLVLPAEEGGYNVAWEDLPTGQRTVLHHFEPIAGSVIFPELAWPPPLYLATAYACEVAKMNPGVQLWTPEAKPPCWYETVCPMPKEEADG
jgi:hypothetical protein